MMKQTTALLLAAALTVTLAGCNTASSGSESTAATAISTNAVEELKADTTLVFADGGITVSGRETGYEVEGTALTIDKAGVYQLSGSCEDGSVKVKKGTTGVTLLLNGLTLTSTDTAPIVCAKSTEVTIRAAAGSVNTLTDSAKNNDDDFPKNENAENAVIKCKDGSQVVLEGTGVLRIVSKGKNGIKSGCELDGRAASLTIRELTLDIDAPVNDAVNAEQLLNVESGDLTIFAGDDALHCDLVLNVGAEGTAGPSITITGCEEGIEGAELNILSGNISIQANDDCLNAANSDLESYAFAINISGGSIVAYSASGDGFDSNGDMTISGGYVEVWTANRADNQPLDADGTIRITGGTVLAGGGSSGMGLSLVTEQGCVVYGSNNGMGGGFGGGRPGMAGQKDPGQPPEDLPERMPEGQFAQGAPDGQTPPEQPQGRQPMDPKDEENFGLFGGSAQTLFAEGQSFSIEDAAGNVLCSGTAPCDTGYLLYCSADVMPEQSYELLAADAVVDTQTAASGQVADSGHFGGGMLGGFAARLTSWTKKA